MKLTRKQKDILEMAGVSGKENAIAKFLKNEYQELGFKTINDGLGSIFAIKKSKLKNAPKVMLATHMDEVGFAVKSVNKMGLIELVMVGGIWNQTVQATRVKLTTRDGKELKGAIIATSSHLLTPTQLKKPVEFSTMLADFGFKSKEEVKKAGIIMNDQITYDEPVVEMANNRILSKAIDDRMGCIIGLEILNEFKNIDLPFDLYVGATVQEEVGIRGAQTSTALIEPDFAIVSDVSAARDTTNKDEQGQIGEGTMIRLMDRGMITPFHLIQYQEEIAKKNKIKTQYYVSPGGTDAMAIHQSLSGIPTIQCAMVARSLHNACTVIDMFDVQETIKMIGAILKDIDAKKLEDWKNV